MFDLAEKLEFTATSEDGRVLDALAHAQRHQRGEYITAFDEEGKEVVMICIGLAVVFRHAYVSECEVLCAGGLLVGR